MPGWKDVNIPAQSGRTAVVTGANSGIGYVTARERTAPGRLREADGRLVRLPAALTGAHPAPAAPPPAPATLPSAPPRAYSVPARARRLEAMDDDATDNHPHPVTCDAARPCVAGR